jgi:hypothetical protein
MKRVQSGGYDGLGLVLLRFDDLVEREEGG